MDYTFPRTRGQHRRSPILTASPSEHPGHIGNASHNSGAEWPLVWYPAEANRLLEAWCGTSGARLGRPNNSVCGTQKHCQHGCWRRRSGAAAVAVTAANALTGVRLTRPRVASADCGNRHPLPAGALVATRNHARGQRQRSREIKEAIEADNATSEPPPTAEPAQPKPTPAAKYGLGCVRYGKSTSC